MVVAKIEDDGSETFSLPKGKKRKKETKLGAAFREVEEESGLTRDKLRIVGVLAEFTRYGSGMQGAKDFSDYKRIRIYAAGSNGRNLKPQDEKKHPWAKWMDIDEAIDTFTHRIDRLMLGEAEPRLRQAHEILVQNGYLIPDEDIEPPVIVSVLQKVDGRTLSGRVGRDETIHAS